MIAAEPDNDEDDSKISKVIRLKSWKLNEDIFAYLRANLLNSYSGKNTQYLLISSPVDINFEMLVVACAINLLQGLKESRFKGTVKEDEEL